MTHNVLPLPRSNGFHGKPSQRCNKPRLPAHTLGRSLERSDALAERVDGDGRILAAGRQPQRRPGGGAER